MKKNTPNNNSIDIPETSFRNKYKEEEKVQKEIEKAKQRIEKAKERQKQSLEKKINALKQSSERKVKLKENKEWKKAESYARKKLNMPQTKKTSWRKDSVAHWRKKAYAEVQKYAKLARADSKGYVITADTGQRKHYTKVDGGHVYSKHNYPHIAFEWELNIRPITKKTNMMQMDGYGERCRNVFTTGMEYLLKKMANEKTKVNFTKEYYKKKYDEYKALNDDIEKKLK